MLQLAPGHSSESDVRSRSANIRAKAINFAVPTRPNCITLLIDCPFFCPRQCFATLRAEDFNPHTSARFIRFDLVLASNPCFVSFWVRGLFPLFVGVIQNYPSKLFLPKTLSIYVFWPIVQEYLLVVYSFIVNVVWFYTFIVIFIELTERCNVTEVVYSENVFSFCSDFDE